MSTKIDTLIPDIYALFSDEKVELDEALLDSLGESVKAAVKKAVEKSHEQQEASLRLSGIGKPDRQLWFEINSGQTFKPGPSDYIKFLFGDILEALLVFFVKQAGHTITHAQDDVELEGVPGHPDGVVDKVPVDFKTASNYSFNTKFKTGVLLKSSPEDDPFGYKAQLRSYRDVLVEQYPEDVVDDLMAWIVFNKESGELLLLKTDPYLVDDGAERVKHVKEMVSKPTPPKEKCFPDKEDGKSGNRVLHKLCEFCSHKDACWKDANNGQGLRVFEYSTGKKYFTNISKLPRVQETKDYEFQVES